jgi:hypothetical protein
VSLTVNFTDISDRRSSRCVRITQVLDPTPCHEITRLAPVLAGRSADSYNARCLLTLSLHGAISRAPTPPRGGTLQQLEISHLFLESFLAVSLGKEEFLKVSARVLFLASLLVSVVISLLTCPEGSFFRTQNSILCFKPDCLSALRCASLGI